MTGKKIIHFEYRDYQGYYPVRIGTVLAETENGVYFKSGFRTYFALKQTSPAAAQVGYVELVITE